LEHDDEGVWCFFWGNENVLKLTATTDVQFSKYTMACELYLNKAVKKKNKELNTKLLSHWVPSQQTGS